MKKILLVLTMFVSLITYSQTSFVLDGSAGIQNIVTCEGMFLDTGNDGVPTDPLRFYQDNERDTITFCSDFQGKKIRFIVDEFNLEIGDVLYVYDGPIVTPNNLIGSYSQAPSVGQQLLPGDTLQSPPASATGCLTFVFVSDGDTKTNSGWKFNISCYVPCQDIVGVGTFNGVAAEDSIFHLCKNDIIDLAGFGIYPDMGTPAQLYTQTNPLSSFTWFIFGPAGQETSTTEAGVFNPTTGFSEASHTFADSGIYHIVLEIKDTLTEFECKNKNYVHNIVYVSGPPVFISDENPKDSTLAELPIICLGDTNYLIGIVDTTFHIDDCKPKPTQPKLIPDGADDGGLQTIEIEAEYKCYGKLVIDDPSDIESICIDMEHSAIGDLEMYLTCPSGQSVQFLSPDVLQNANLGSPVLIGTTQGVDSTYCFSMSATETLNERADGLSTSALVPNTPALPSGLGFANLVGCRINGKWTLSVRDRRINDNGWVVKWEIAFNPSIQPVSDTLFYNTYVDSNWMEDPTNPSLGINLSPLTKGDTLVVLPTEPGTYKYTFQVEDDFGCQYDTIVNFQVIDRKQADFTYNGDTVYCEGESGTLTPTFLPGFNNIMGEAGIFTVTPATGLTINPTTGVITIDATTVAGLYEITNTVTTNPGGCVDEHVFASSILIFPKPLPTILGAGSYCQTDTLTIQPGATDRPYDSFSWSNGNTNDTLFATSANNPITVTVTDTNGCVGVSTPVSVTALAQVEHTATITICEGGSALIHGIVQTQPGVYSQLFGTGQTSCDSVSTITLQFYPRVSIGPDVTICENSCTDLSASLPDMTNANFTWSNGIFGPTQNVCPIINTQYSVVATDGNGCVTRDTVMVFVNPTRDLGLVYDLGTVCINSPSPVPTFNAFPGYLFSSNPAGVNAVTGLLSATQLATPGTYGILLDDGIYQCNINNTASITVTSAPDPTFSFGPICVPGTSACPSFAAGASAGVFTFTDPTTTGIVMNSGSGCIDLTATNSGTYSLTNRIAASGVCPDTSFTLIINVNDKPIVSGTASNTNFCVGDCSVLTGSSNSINPMTYTWDNGVTDNVQFCPPSSQTYTVTGADQVTGCSNTAIVSVIVNQLPVIDPITPDVLCLGESTTITAFSPNSITETISYDWDNGLGSGPSKLVTPNVTTTYIVTATNNTTLCQNTGAVTIVVNQPIIDAGVDQAICFNQQANLNATGANSYTWTPSAGLTNSTIANPTTTITATTTFSVIGTDVNGCTFEDFVTVTVNSLPTITATAVPNEVCVGQSTVITANGAVTYTANGNGFTAGNTTTYTASVVPSEDIIIEGTDANGCRNTFIVPITVNPLPVITVTPDDAICAGETVVLFGSAPGSVLVNWTGGTGSIANGVGFAPTSSAQYTCTITDNNACVNTATVNIAVNSLPVVVGNAAPAVLCEGDLLTLTGSGAGTGAVYLWSNGVVNGIGFNVSSTTSTFTVTGIDANGCSNTDEVTVTINPNPQILVKAQDSTICVGNTANIFVNPVIAGATYAWSPVGSGDNFEDTPGVGIVNYEVVVTDPNGCTATDDLDITVVANDVLANFSPTENSNIVNDNVIFPGDQITYVNNSLNANSYIWDLKDGNGLFTTVSKGDQSASYQDTGVYYIYLQATNQITGCVDDTVVMIRVVPFDGAIVCSPNIFTPNGDKENDVFYVDICYGLIEKLEVVVYNRWGNEIHSISGEYDPNDPKTYWDGTQDGKPVSEGVYFYKYEAQGKNGEVVKGHDNVHVVRNK